MIDILQEFQDCDALKEGHFVLTSGLHSSQYIQCALVFTDADRAERLCSILADNVTQQFGENFADIIVAPAVGAIIMGHIMGDLLNLESVFCERGKDDKFELKRDFAPKVEGKRVLIAEVVMTTGKSSLETIDCIQEAGGTVVGECVFVNRCKNPDVLPVPMVSLIDFDLPTYTEDNLPEELQKIPPIYPGSRKKF